MSNSKPPEFVETTKKDSVHYNSYLKLDQLLSAVQPISRNSNNVPFHDEHLFIVTHQTYELWFKQIIFEIDSIRSIFQVPLMDERYMLMLVNRLQRIVLILKHLVDQIMILETMTALDFMEFRKFLEPASGFQSLQFRLMENKLGVKEENRVKYNSQNYKEVFYMAEHLNALKLSSTEPSLVDLLQNWLERTPGLVDDDYVFWDEYVAAIRHYLQQEVYLSAQNETDPNLKETRLADYKKLTDSFEAVFDKSLYDTFVERGERTFSHKAFQGALMIFLYREEPRYSQPFQVLQLLMDIDSLLTKWRHNHVVLVQRMIGNKVGTGGSSGYLYLRSTVSERYMPFADLFKLSTYMLPRNCIPPLSNKVKQKLSGINDYVTQ